MTFQNSIWNKYCWHSTVSYNNHETFWDYCLPKEKIAYDQVGFWNIVQGTPRSDLKHCILGHHLFKQLCQGWSPSWLTSSLLWESLATILFFLLMTFYRPSTTGTWQHLSTDLRKRVKLYWRRKCLQVFLQHTTLLFEKKEAVWTETKQGKCNVGIIKYWAGFELNWCTQMKCMCF